VLHHDRVGIERGVGSEVVVAPLAQQQTVGAESGSDGPEAMARASRRQTAGVSKRRLAVVMIIGDPWGTEIDGLRRALGDSQLRRIVPHITLIPPINVRDDALPEVLAVMRNAAATRRGPVTLTVGPVATFAPANPVLYLQVEPAGEVRSLFNACLVGPLERPQQREFVPHVTIDINRPDDEHAAARSLLSGYRADVTIERLDLMQLAMIDGRERWQPIADADFGGAVSVDAGSLRVTLTTSTLVDPVASATLELDSDRLLGNGMGDGLVVTARDPQGRAVGLAAGRRRGRRASVLRAIFVADGARRQGLARRLVEAWERVAVSGGAVRAVAPGLSSDERALLSHLGWDQSEPIPDRRFS